MLNFKNNFYGFRAGSRNARNILLKLKGQGKVPSIRNFTPIFSPRTENDTDKHMSNISKLSRIGLDDAINPDDDTQFFKFLTGLAIAESGMKSLKGVNQKTIMDAIKSGRKSL